MLNYLSHKFPNNPQSRYPTNTKTQTPKWHFPLKIEHFVNTTADMVFIHLPGE